MKKPTKQYFTAETFRGPNEITISAYNPKSQKYRHNRTQAYLKKKKNGLERWVWRTREYTPAELAKRFNYWIKANTKNPETEITIFLKTQKYYKTTGEWDTAKSTVFKLQNGVLRRDYY